MAVAKTSSERREINDFLTAKGLTGAHHKGVGDDLELRLKKKLEVAFDDDDMRATIEREFERMPHAQAHAAQIVEIDQHLLEGAFGAKPNATTRGIALKKMEQAAREMLGEAATAEEVVALASRSFKAAITAWGGDLKTLAPGADPRRTSGEEPIDARRVLREDNGMMGNPTRNPFSPEFRGTNREDEMLKLIKTSATRAAKLAHSVNCTIAGVKMIKPQHKF